MGKITFVCGVALTTVGESPYISNIKDVQEYVHMVAFLQSLSNHCSTCKSHDNNHQQVSKVFEPLLTQL